MDPEPRKVWPGEICICICISSTALSSLDLFGYGFVPSSPVLICFFAIQHLLITMDGAQLNWVHEKPDSSQAGQPKSLYNETGARRRRTHQKSRKGCIGCKHRRVKCDEGRPSCGQCVERKWRCEFADAATATPSVTAASRRSTPKPSVTPPASEKMSSSPASDVSDQNHGSRDWTRSRILAFLERTNVPSQLSDCAVYQRQDALELMAHFEDTTEPWIGSSHAQKWIQTRGLQLGLIAP